MYRRNNNYPDTIYRLSQKGPNTTCLDEHLICSYFNISDSFHTGMDLNNGGKLKEIKGISNYHNLTYITIPNGVTKIGSLHGLSSLPSLSFPSTLKELGSISFCLKLKGISFSGSVERCGQIGCLNLERLELGSMQRLEQITTGGKLSSLKIPDSMTYLGDICQATCLTTLDLGTSLKHIGNINGCMSSLLIPSSVTHIGTLSCSGLTSLVIPSSVQEFEALYGCDRLESIVIPNSVTRFNYISNCSSLVLITIGKGIKQLKEGMISQCTRLQRIYSPYSLSNTLPNVNLIILSKPEQIDIPYYFHLKDEENDKYLRDVIYIINNGILPRNISQSKVNEYWYDMFDAVYSLVFNEMIENRIQKDEIDFLLQTLEMGRMFYDN